MYSHKSVTKLGNNFELCKKKLIFFINKRIFLSKKHKYGMKINHFLPKSSPCAPDRTRTCTS